VTITVPADRGMTKTGQGEPRASPPARPLTGVSVATVRDARIGKAWADHPTSPDMAPAYRSGVQLWARSEKAGRLSVTQSRPDRVSCRRACVSLDLLPSDPHQRWADVPARWRWDDGVPAKRGRCRRPPLGSISSTRTVAGIQSGFAQQLDNENPRSGDINCPFEFRDILT
jgi:hypothetical protein